MLSLSSRLGVAIYRGALLVKFAPFTFKIQVGTVRVFHSQGVVKQLHVNVHVRERARVRMQQERLVTVPQHRPQQATVT